VLAVMWEFADALGAEDVVTVSGTALTLAQAGGFFNWQHRWRCRRCRRNDIRKPGMERVCPDTQRLGQEALKLTGVTEGFLIRWAQTVVVKLFVDSGT